MPPPPSPTLTPANAPVYLDDLLDAPATRQTGFRPYVARVARIDGTDYLRSLMTEVGGVRAEENLSTLTLRLDGAYLTFAATVGREDADTARGPGYVWFEIYGDKKLLYRSSSAIRSSRYLVKASPGAKIRKASLTTEVSVKGVRELQLVTRYATEFAQEAPLVQRARGCVWADARLIPVLAPTPPPRPADTLRDTIRLAALQLASLTVPYTDPEGKPLLIFLTPFTGDTRSLPDSEKNLTSLLREMLSNIRRSGRSVFALPDGGTERNFQRTLRDRKATDLAIARLLEGAFLLRTAVLPADRENGLRLELRLYDAKQDRETQISNPVTVSIPTTTR